MKWLLRILLLLATLAVVFAAALFWILRTESGLRFALTLTGAQTFSYQSISGSLAAGATVHGLDASWPDVTIHAERIALRLAPGRLRYREVMVETLSTRGLTIAPQASDAPPSRTRPGKLDLPFAIVLRNLDLTETGIDTGGEAPLVFSLAARELSLRDGQLAIEGIVLRAGELLLKLRGASDSGKSWASSLDSESELPFNDRAQRAQVGVQGDLDALDVTASINDGDVTLKANVADVLGSGATDGRLQALGIDPREFGLDAGVESLDLDLQFGWRDGRASVSGSAEVNRQKLEVALIDIGVRDGQVQFGEVRMGSDALGQVILRGAWPLDASAPSGALALDLENAALADWRAPVADAPRLTSAGTLSGRLDDWQLALDGRLLHAAQTLALTAQIKGDDTRIELTKLLLQQSAIAAIETPAGQQDRQENTTATTEIEQANIEQSTARIQPTLEFSGTLDRTTLALQASAAAVSWQLDAYLSDWPGQISGTINGSVELTDPLRWRVDTDRLEGTLRGAAVSLNGQLSGVDAQPQSGSIAVLWGDGRTQMNALGAGRLQATMQDLDLMLATQSVRGSLSGNAQIDLAATDPVDALTADVRASELAQAENSIGQIALVKAPGWNADIQARDLRLFGLSLQSLDAQLTGAASAHQFSAQLGAKDLELDIGAAGGVDGNAWRGVIDALTLKVARLPAYSLQAPAAVAVQADRLVIAPVCLGAGAARACVGVERGTDMSLDLDLSAMPLSLAQSLLPGDTFEVDGQLSGGGRLGIAADQSLNGQLEFVVENGTLKGASEFEAPIAFQARAALDAAAQRVDARLSLADDGFIEALVTDVMRETAMLTVTLKINDLALAETVTPEVQSIRGALSGSLSVPLGTPQALAGQLRADRMAFELPSVGLKVSQGRIDGTIGANALALQGDLAIAPGTVKLSGRIALDGSASEIQLIADNAGLVDLPAVRLAGDTNLMIKLDSSGAAIEGGVLLRAGRIHLDRFAPAVAPSEDVVIVDAPPPPAPLPIRAEVSVAFIQEVDLRGYGLIATLGGGLRISQTPGKKPRGTGEMLVKGTYQAYGQRLAIERGRLRFSGGAADNPALDILAAKSVQRQRVGVEVRGRAQRPLIQLYSDPQLDQSEALSYLVLGRPITTASSDDSARLGEYADALESAGGSLIAGSIGQRLGLAAGIESLGSSIGSALVVGKYVSPRFFIGYGSSLLDAIQLVILRYRVTESIEVEGISGNEQKASVSWRTER